MKSSAPLSIFFFLRLVDCIYLGSSSPALIASILRDPSTYATGLMNHHTWIDPLSETDSSSTPPRPSTTTPTTTTTTTTTTSTSNEREAQTENSQEGLAARATDQPQDQSHQDEMGAGLAGAEFQTWEACERVVLKEQQDFYEFALCNLAIAAISLIVYGFRTKQLVIKQYGKLAARIGIPPS
ncbi:hypothetical protein VP01_592g9 [Puccinia sorghi]|uniref:Uncharacterized protein n=1 Tax=Puccinia sorghi TaxID=27349 RepID=A0A0L6UHS1_9BASI|nr:hypothetical protein VP01_592g9 [Puccinia sorghi]